jgi:hypothetical protein
MAAELTDPVRKRMGTAEGRMDDESSLGRRSGRRRSSTNLDYTPDSPNRRQGALSSGPLRVAWAHPHHDRNDCHRRRRHRADSPRPDRAAGHPGAGSADPTIPADLSGLGRAGGVAASPPEWITMSEGPDPLAARRRREVDGPGRRHPRPVLPVPGSSTAASTASGCSRPPDGPSPASSDPTRSGVPPAPASPTASGRASMPGRWRRGLPVGRPAVKAARTGRTAWPGRTASPGAAGSPRGRGAP